MGIERGPSPPPAIGDELEPRIHRGLRPAQVGGVEAQHEARDLGRFQAARERTDDGAAVVDQPLLPAGALFRGQHLVADVLAQARMRERVAGLDQVDEAPEASNASIESEAVLHLAGGDTEDVVAPDRTERTAQHAENRRGRALLDEGLVVVRPELVVPDAGKTRLEIRRQRVRRQPVGLRSFELLDEELEQEGIAFAHVEHALQAVRVGRDPVLPYGAQRLGHAGAIEGIQPLGDDAARGQREPAPQNLVGPAGLAAERQQHLAATREIGRQQRGVELPVGGLVDPVEEEQEAAIACQPPPQVVAEQPAARHQSEVRRRRLVVERRDSRDQRRNHRTGPVGPEEAANRDEDDRQIRPWCALGDQVSNDRGFAPAARCDEETVRWRVSVVDPLAQACHRVAPTTEGDRVVGGPQVVDEECAHGHGVGYALEQIVDPLALRQRRRLH